MEKTDKQILIEKIEWITREMNSIGTSNNSDNLNELLKYELYKKKEQYQVELGQIIFDELDERIQKEIERSREAKRHKFYSSLNS